MACAIRSMKRFNNRYARRFFHNWRKVVMEQIMQEEIEEQKGLLNKITENSREVCRLNEIHEWKNKEVEKIKFWLTIANTELDQERTNCQIKIEQLEKTRKNYISNKVYYS